MKLLIHITVSLALTDLSVRVLTAARAPFVFAGKSSSTQGSSILRWRPAGQRLPFESTDENNQQKGKKNINKLFFIIVDILLFCPFNNVKKKKSCDV